AAFHGLFSPLLHTASGFSPAKLHSPLTEGVRVMSMYAANPAAMTGPIPTCAFAQRDTACWLDAMSNPPAASFSILCINVVRNGAHVLGSWCAARSGFAVALRLSCN